MAAISQEVFLDMVHLPAGVVVDLANVDTHGGQPFFKVITFEQHLAGTESVKW